jgi:hypothetical protein
MIDLNRIRKLETLDEHIQDLTEFINNPIMVECYKDQGMDKEDYESDREQAISLLAKVNLRKKSLSKHLAKTQGAK